MEQMNMRVIGRCSGTAVLGPRGQSVIPVKARKELGIGTGKRLLVFGHSCEWGLIFIEAEAAEELLNFMSIQLDEVAKLVKENQIAEVGLAGESKAS